MQQLKRVSIPCNKKLIKIMKRFSKSYKHATQLLYESNNTKCIQFTVLKMTEYKVSRQIFPTSLEDNIALLHLIFLIRTKNVIRKSDIMSTSLFYCTSLAD